MVNPKIVRSLLAVKSNEKRDKELHYLPIKFQPIFSIPAVRVLQTKVPDLLQTNVSNNL